jgi:hypothetical protein
MKTTDQERISRTGPEVKEESLVQGELFTRSKSGGDQFANREDSRFEDSARRVHLFTWHLMRQRDVADFNEKMFAYNSDSDESQDDDI